MITLDEAKTISAVFKRFAEGEVLEWTSLDDCMEFLSWLPDEQLVTETHIILEGHMNANARCALNHSQDRCFVPVVLDAIGYLLKDFKESNRLPKKNRYIIEYYLALTQTGEIITD